MWADVCDCRTSLRVIASRTKKSKMQLVFIGIPLILVVLPAVVTLVRQAPEAQFGRIHMLFVWLSAYSMLVSGFGFLSMVAVFFSNAAIPGTASEGGNIGGKYYFNWHDETYTEVSKQTWERAYFVEQLAAHTIFVPVGVLLISVSVLFVATRRLKRNRLTSEHSGSGSIR